MPKKPMTYDEQVFVVELGERLRSALETREITQNQLAKKVGVDRARINQVVRGCPKHPCGIILFRKICRELKINANYLLDNPNKKKVKTPTETTPIRNTGVTRRRY